MTELFSKDVLDIIVAIAAVGGLLLGVYNTVHQQLKTKIRMRVKPRWHEWQMMEEITIGGKGTGHNYPTGEEYRVLGIEIINLSSFPVSIVEIGFMLNDSMPFAVPPMNESKLPILMGAHSSIIACPRVKQLSQAVHLSNKEISFCYVKTATDLMFKGKGPELSEFESLLANKEEEDIKLIFRTSEADTQ